MVSNDSIIELKNFTKLVNDLEIQTLLSNEEDNKNAILTIHPGAGGKDSQDWAYMLYRMYVKWAELNKYKYTILSYTEGDETGLKEVSIEIDGNYIFGLFCGLITASTFTSSNKCEPPRKSSPRLTILLGKTSGQANLVLLARKFGNEYMSPSTTIPRIATIFHFEKYITLEKPYFYYFFPNKPPKRPLDCS